MPPGGGQGPRKIASIGVHVSRWVTTHGYALNVDLDPAPFTEWITACGLEDAQFTTMARELERPLTVEDVRPAAIAAIAEVFGLELEELPADDGAGLWPQAIHASLGRAMTVDIRPVPASRLGSAPGRRRRRCRRPRARPRGRYFVAQLRFSEHATIHEHPGENDTIVVCLEGAGYTSVAGKTAPPSRGTAGARGPRRTRTDSGREDSTMTTLMVEHFD